MVCQSICLSRSQKAEDVDRISVACTRQPHVQFPIFPQSDQPSVDLSVGDIRWQIATEWLDIAQWLIGYRECRKATTAPLSNGTITDPLRPPLPSNGSPKCTLQDQRRDVCCHVANIRYRQGSCVLCRMSL